MLALALVTLGGCVPIAGTLDVRAPIKLAITEIYEDADECALAYFDADCPRHETRKQTTLNTGRYQASLDMSNRSALTLQLTERDDTRREVRFSVPRQLRIPEKAGRFVLRAGELQQPVDVSGNVSTRSTHSNLRREYEFCSYEIERWVCGGKRHGAAHPGHLNQRVSHAHKPRHGPACGWRTRTVRGSRQVEFFLEFETRTVTLDLLDPGTPKPLAHFEGAQTQTHKHYQRVGACF